MRWAKSEYILKGVFLGLLLFIAVQKDLDWSGLGRIALWLGGGFAAAIVLSAARQLKEIRSLGRNPVGFLLFLLLENPGLMYTGLVMGAALGAITEARAQSATGELDSPIIGYCVLGGAILGYALGEIRELTRGMVRFLLAIAVTGAAFAGVYFWLEDAGSLVDESRRTLLGVYLLLGIPFFYLLVFCGMTEESEVEIAALCGALGLSLYLMKFPSKLPAAGLLVPVGLYCVYSIRILKPLRVFKHSLRGYGHYEVGRVRHALASFNRALQLDPKNQLARRGLVRLHRGLDLKQLDDETKGLLNPNLCVAEAAKTLLGSSTPDPTAIAGAASLLDFVAGQWPQFRACTDYYRVVADTHGKKLDEASSRLAQLLDPNPWPAGDKFRSAMLFDAWQLALRTHPELRRRAGEPQLAQPGRRIEAIQAAQRQANAHPADPAPKDFVSELMQGLSEEEYFDAAVEGPLTDFPYASAESIGAAEFTESARRDHAESMLRIAAHGLPEQGGRLLQPIIDAAEKSGDAEKARRHRRVLRDGARGLGTAKLSADAKAAYFAVVKKLADEAAAGKDWKEAILNYTLLSQAENSGKEVLRTLAQMYENDGQVMQALRYTEDALIRGADTDLNERKDKYYYSVEPAQLKAVAEQVLGYFDVKYCVRKAKAILDSNSPELENLDWAQHLAGLALVMEPKHLIAHVQMARCHLRRGEREQGLSFLEDVREMKASGVEEREAAEWTLRQLGLLYLDEFNRADLAVDCFQKFLDSEKSGARTLYDLGRAYEQTGDLVKALVNFRQAASYEDNPVRWDAEEAIRRVKARQEAPRAESAPMEKPTNTDNIG